MLSWTKSAMFSLSVVAVACGTEPRVQATSIAEVTTGDVHTCVRRMEGPIACFGQGAQGRLGNGGSGILGADPDDLSSALSWLTWEEQVVQQLSAGGGHTCAVFDDGVLRCWGSAYAGRIGNETSYEHVGDDPTENEADFIPVALPLGDVEQVSAGFAHTCVRFRGGEVACFGHGQFGRLGSGDGEHRGDDPGEMGAELPLVDLGPLGAQDIAAGGDHSCAVLTDGTVRCWGAAHTGRLGLGDLEDRGDEPGEMGTALPPVSLGVSTPVRQVSTGGGHTCVLFDSGGVKCWGENTWGQLGLGDTVHRGETPQQMGEALPFVDLGHELRATSIAAGGSHTCALLENGCVKCWGANHWGVLGLGVPTADPVGGDPTGDVTHRGDEAGEMGDELPCVELGPLHAIAVSAATRHTCALLENQRVKCWGAGSDGQLGSGSNEPIGDDPEEMGAALEYLDL